MIFFLTELRFPRFAKNQPSSFSLLITIFTFRNNKQFASRTSKKKNPLAEQIFTQITAYQ